MAVETLDVTEPVHVMGLVIGAMTAVAYALSHGADVRTLSFGEAPIPGTQAYEQLKASPAMYYFLFRLLVGFFARHAPEGRARPA